MIAIETLKFATFNFGSFDRNEKSLGHVNASLGNTNFMETVIVFMQNLHITMVYKVYLGFARLYSLSCLLCCLSIMIVYYAGMLVCMLY